MPNLLTQVIATVATPGWGDGKNGNDSYVDLSVIIRTTDGAEHRTGAHLGDNTGIGQNNAIYPTFPLSSSLGNLSTIKYEDVNEVQLDVLYYKPNADITTSDAWDVRFEVCLSFQNGSVLATGYNEPAKHLEFHNYPHKQGLTVFNVKRAGMFNAPTLVSPFG